MSTEPKNQDNSQVDHSVTSLWIILNLVLVIYALILFIYGKYCRRKDSLSYVIIFVILYNYFL